MSICILDTSVFMELLRVPGRCARHKEVVAELRDKIQKLEKLFLPMATIFETGNHIAQQGDGRERRSCAQRFVDEVRKALSGESPFVPLAFVTSEQMSEWLDRFPDMAMRELGLGDLSILDDCTRARRLNPSRTVYVWTFDEKLRSQSEATA